MCLMPTILVRSGAGSMRPGRRSSPFRYVSETDRDPTPDERNAKWAAGQLKAFAQNKDKRPFFLAVGFIRPHTPLHVPKKFFDQFPLNKVKLPVIKDGDADDTYYADHYDGEARGLKMFRLLCESYPDCKDGIRAFTQAYLASVAAADECVGQVIEAVDNSPLKSNTIVIVTSDHGWNMGAKNLLYKNSLWEESVRVPLIVRAPGITPSGAVADHPVSLIDLYPTLVDLCALKGATMKNENGAALDGHSLRPLLENPKADRWDGPDAALTMIYAGPESQDDPAKQHWSVRTKKWRYIRYNDGKQELYDHDIDPHEWNNVVSKFPDVAAEHKARISKMTKLDLTAPEPGGTQ
jgi:arylsulfatase A-like enzyme